MSKKRIAEILVNEWKLANGWTPARILQEHFAAEQRLSKIASVRMEAAEARVLVAGITQDFVKDVAKALKTSLGSVVELLKDSRVTRFFSKVGWSFQKLYDLAKKGYHTYKEVRDIIRKFAESIGARGYRWTNEQLAKLDNFVRSNPILMRVSGFALAGLLAYIWFRQADTGDATFDFDASDIINAFSGNYSFLDMFGGKDGLMYLVTLALGTSGMSFVWPGSGSAQFISSVLVALINSLHIRFRKEKPKSDEKVPVLAV